MEVFWIVAGVVAVILFIISQNRTKISDRTTVTTRKTIKTEDGEIQIQRTQTVDSVISQYHPPATSSAPPKAEYNLEAIHDYYKAISQNPPVVQLASTDIVEETPKNLAYVASPTAISSPDATASDPDKKQCKRCNRNQVLDKFGSNSKSPDGRTVWCRECLNAPKDTAKQKYCPKCKHRRMKNNFYPNNNRKDGLTLWCKSCMDKSNRR